MPGEFDALAAFFRDYEKKEDAKRKKRRIVNPRRVELSTCTASLDRDRNGKQRLSLS